MKLITPALYVGMKKTHIINGCDNNLIYDLKKKQNMNIYQKEYETYIKQVTEGFINMQLQTTTQEYSKKVMTQLSVVEWTGGLEWKLYKQGETFRDGNLMEETRHYNSHIALAYLKANSLTYDEWIVKYKR